MTTTLAQIPLFEGAAMKLSHSNDSIVTAVDDDVSIPQFFSTGFPKNTINTPDLAELGTYLDKLFGKHYSKLLNKGGRKMKIAGILGSNDAGCQAYGKSLKGYCDNLGIEFDVYSIIGQSFEDAKGCIAEMNRRNGVDGMIVFTPIFGGELVSRVPLSVSFLSTHIIIIIDQTREQTG
jgi:hypothetical protein